MTATIKLKKSSVSNNAPGTGDIDYGELAINYADGNLYYKNSSNVIKNFADSDNVQLSINAAITAAGSYNNASVDTHLNQSTASSGEVLSWNGSDYDWVSAADSTKLPLAGGTMTGDLSFGDNNKAIFGAGSDLQIFHNASNSYITDAGQGKLIVSSNGQSVDVYDNANGHTMAQFTNNAGVTLAYQGATKIATTSTGIDVTGTVTSDGLTISGPNFPLARIERQTSLTNALRSTFAAVHTTSANMVDGFGADISFIIRDSANVDNEIANFGARRDGADNSGSLVFATTLNGTQQGLPKMILKSSGNVGIGTQTPSEKLEVSGNIAVSGTVDGRDVSVDGTKLDGIESNAKDDQTITAGSGLTGGGTGDVTLNHADTSSQASSNNSGRTYIQDITLDTYGHITGLATATETVTNTNLTHTGEVTGSTSLTITDNVVDEANLKVSNSPTNGYVLTAQSGNTGGLTWAAVSSGSGIDSAAVTALVDSDYVQARANISVIGDANTVILNEYTGDSSATAFTLTHSPTTDQHAIVMVDGVVQQVNNYSLSGSQITLDEAPVTGAEIEVRTLRMQTGAVTVRDFADYIYQPSSATTTFSGADINAQTLLYDVNKLDVYMNGARLVHGLDYTATNGSSVTLLGDAADSGDTINISSFASSTINGSRNNTVLSTTTANQTVDTFNKTVSRSAKYIVQMTQGSRYHSQEVMLIHDGTTVSMTKYADIYTDSDLGTVDADISGNLVRLQVSPNYTNTAVKTHRTEVGV